MGRLLNIAPFTRAKSHVLPWFVALLWAGSLLPAQVVGDYVPYLPQGFFFDWTPQGQSPPVPATAQCESIHIAWDRGAATGPNPTAPYYLQIYTSAFVVPFIVQAGANPAQLEFDFPVPWIPGTIYQICMFDKNGVTGGCQASYSIYQAPNTTFANPPTCQNLTYPTSDKVLEVDAQVDNGAMSQYGWIDQCTDISLTPKNGTPPYTMTVAPALHPPFNITSNTQGAINWTVSLSWGSPFFVSVVDANGATWANGPLHSGGGGTTECLALTNEVASPSKEIKPWIAAVSGAAGLVVGILVGLCGACIIIRIQRRRRPIRPSAMHRKSSSMSVTAPVLARVHSSEQYLDNPPDQITTHQRFRDGPYQIEPLHLNGDEFGNNRVTSYSGYDRSSGTMFDSSGHGRSLSLSQDHLTRSPPPSVVSPTSTVAPHTPPQPIAPPAPAPPPPLSSETRTSSHVYVVHHDSGRAPVTVYGPDGTEVVELPPRYTDSSAGASAAMSAHSAATSARTATTLTGPVAPLQVQERRVAGPSPPKGPRRVVN